MNKVRCHINARAIALILARWMMAQGMGMESNTHTHTKFKFSFSLFLCVMAKDMTMIERTETNWGKTSDRERDRERERKTDSQISQWLRHLSSETSAHTHTQIPLGKFLTFASLNCLFWYYLFNVENFVARTWAAPSSSLWWRACSHALSLTLYVFAGLFICTKSRIIKLKLNVQCCCCHHHQQCHCVVVKFEMPFTVVVLA